MRTIYFSKFDSKNANFGFFNKKGSRERTSSGRNNNSRERASFKWGLLKNDVFTYSVRNTNMIYI